MRISSTPTPWASKFSMIILAPKAVDSRSAR